MQQLQTIAGVARGLTRTNESLLIFDDSPDIQKELEQMKHARQDQRVVRIREAILDGIRRTVNLWSTDATVGNVSRRKGSPLVFSNHSSCIGVERALQSYHFTTHGRYAPLA